METALTRKVLVLEEYATGKARKLLDRASECNDFNPVKRRIRSFEFGSVGIKVLAAANDAVVAMPSVESIQGRRRLK